MGKLENTTDQIVGGVAESLRHDSAVNHVTGRSTYIDDILEPRGTLFVVPGGAPFASGKITEIDLSKVEGAPGVVTVLTAADIPGHNDFSPTHSGDDPVLADGQVGYFGQPIFAVVAETYEQARAAVRLAEVSGEAVDPILTIDDALAADSVVSDTYVMARGDVVSAMTAAPNTLSGQIDIGGQEHFYLEGQIALAIPMEDGDVYLHSSTQHPSEVQHNVANILGLPAHAVTVEVRRMGGGFGGKESQPTQWAAMAALGVLKTGRPVKCRLDRDDDIIMTGKRHDIRGYWSVGFDDDGRIIAADVDMATRCGCSKDLSDAISDRAMFHFDNAYYLDAVRISCARLKTNTVSNTAFRGFGGPQGMMIGERMIEAVARAVGKDPLEVRKLNFYGTDDRNVTPYHMTVNDCIIDEMIRDLEAKSNYAKRREEIIAFNASSPVIKKGLALTPVKFGISFTTTFLNQAGALIHIYKDGSILLNHGGTEMGQGLFMKVAQIVAEELQVDIDRIKITSTNTAKVPNTSATAASSGSDMNGMAALVAARTLKRRLTAFAAGEFDCDDTDVEFLPNRVNAGNHVLTFDELINKAYLARVQLSATGFYRTPKIEYDREKAAGRPFYYFAYGAAVSEVAIDTLTGESRVLAVDIIHDVGQSLNPALDTGQIEGGFIQGMGWLTSEELYWNDDGRLMTHAPSTYKIPTCGDRPEHLDITIWDKGRNVENTVHRSKAVGEPPLMLAISVFHAISDAISSLDDYRVVPELDAPATPERILMAVQKMKAGVGA
jgi:xanthine dehydrogenase large subunit